MAWTKEKSAKILRQLRDVTDAVEQLDHGVCQLEAKQLAILAAPRVTKRTKMRNDANFLIAMNASTVAMIQQSLWEIEQVVKREMECAPDAKELVSEFLKVLRESVRVLHDFKMVQEHYVDQLNLRHNRVSLTPSPMPRRKAEPTSMSNLSRSRQLERPRRQIFLVRRVTQFFRLFSCVS